MIKAKIKDLTTKNSFITYIPTLPTEDSIVTFWNEGKKIRCEIDSIELELDKTGLFKYFVLWVFPFE